MTFCGWLLTIVFGYIALAYAVTFIERSFVPTFVAIILGGLIVGSYGRKYITRFFTWLMARVYRTTMIRLIYLEGAPGSGKTYSIRNAAWPAILEPLHFVPEEIPKGVLERFTLAPRECGYVFEQLMVSIRSKTDFECRTDRTRVHVCDRTLIGSFVFHVANFTVGSLTADEFAALRGMDIVEKALAPVVSSNDSKQVVVVYYGTPADVCYKRVVSRGGEDAKIDVRYHRLVSFVYGYVIAYLAESESNVIFLNDADISLTTKLDDNRVEVLRRARANLDIVLTTEERDRFEIATRDMPVTGFRWGKKVDGKVHGRTLKAIIRSGLDEVEAFERAPREASRKSDEVE